METHYFAFFNTFPYKKTAGMRLRQLLWYLALFIWTRYDILPYQ